MKLGAFHPCSPWIPPGSVVERSFFAPSTRHPGRVIIFDMSTVTSFDELEQLLKKLNESSMSEDEESSALTQVCDMADTSGFTEWLSTLPRERYGIRAIVYEALAAEAERFESILFKELMEAVQSAPTVPSPGDVLDPFLELTPLSETGFKLKFRDHLLPLLSAAHPEIRRFVLILIVDFLEPSDRSIIEEIQTILNRDPDWRVRHFAWMTLLELDALPKNYRRPILDRLRAKFLSPLK
jgi:hypothetical protein